MYWEKYTYSLYSYPIWCLQSYKTIEIDKRVAGGNKKLNNLTLQTKWWDILKEPTGTNA